MTCYKPMIRVEDRTKWETALDGHKYHPAKIISSDRLEEFDHKFSMGHYKYTQINCGECIGCRLDYSREWANRGYLESLQYKHNYFITLTYDEDHLPEAEEVTTSSGLTFTELEEYEWKGILVPKEFTQFMKNLRQIMKRDYNVDGVRFMGCGEYGGEGARPHYHIILFNCPLPEETFYNPRISWGKDVYYQNTIIERAWTKGISNICEANWNNIAYTARYITKKINGTGSEEEYAARGQIKEFFRTSRNPGIAREYYEKNKDEIYKTDQIMIKNKKGVHYVKPPKYFDQLYEKENPKEFEKIRKQRKKQTLDNLLIKGQTTSLTRWEQLQIEMTTKEQASSTLKRNLEKELK